MSRQSTIFFSSVIMFIISCYSLSCVETVRNLTYGPDFTYVDRKQMSEAMYTLGISARQLEKLLDKVDPLDLKTSKKPVSEETNTAVIGLLTNMETAAKSLKKQGDPLNHPYFRDKLYELIDSLRVAKQYAERTPPNYYWAGRVSATCTTCHATMR